MNEIKRTFSSELARRLAELGIRPGEDVEVEPIGPEEVEDLTRAWVQEADVDAAMTYEMTGRAGA